LCNGRPWEKVNMKQHIGRGQGKQKGGGRRQLQRVNGPPQFMPITRRRKSGHSDPSAKKGDLRSTRVSNGPNGKPTGGRAGRKKACGGMHRSFILLQRGGHLNRSKTHKTLNARRERAGKGGKSKKTPFHSSCRTT